MTATMTQKMKLQKVLVIKTLELSLKLFIIEEVGNNSAEEGIETKAENIQNLTNRSKGQTKIKEMHRVREMIQNQRSGFLDVRNVTGYIIWQRTVGRIWSVQCVKSVVTQDIGVGITPHLITTKEVVNSRKTLKLGRNGGSPPS